MLQHYLLPYTINNKIRFGIKILTNSRNYFVISKAKFYAKSSLIGRILDKIWRNNVFYVGVCLFKLIFLREDRIIDNLRDLKTCQEIICSFSLNLFFIYLGKTQSFMNIKYFEIRIIICRLMYYKCIKLVQF